MSRSHLPPPQAYTRETLTQAYQWVQNQPEGVRKMADSANALVALYLRAKRNGEVNLEAAPPLVQESFRSNVKGLFAEIHQFTSIAKSATTAHEQTTHEPAEPVQQDSSITELHPEVKIEMKVDNMKPGILDLLDSRSRAVLQKAQQKLNLSSEHEALRALIILGWERLEKL